MSSLKLVQYDSEEEESDSKITQATGITKAVQKKETKENDEKQQRKKEESHLKKEQKEIIGKRIIKYSSLQASKNLLKIDPDLRVNEEWKPTNFDFYKKKDSYNKDSESISQIKKGNSYATNFLSNLPKPKKELKNISKTLFIQDSFIYEDEDCEDVVIKKVKTQSYATKKDNLDTEGTLSISLQQIPAINKYSLTEEDEKKIYSYDKSSKFGDINASKIIEVSADKLTDPNWEQSLQKRITSRLFQNDSKFDQSDKIAKGKNQLTSLLSDAITHEDEYMSKSNFLKDAKKKTSQKYGW